MAQFHPTMQQRLSRGIIPVTSNPGETNFRRIFNGFELNYHSAETADFQVWDITDGTSTFPLDVQDMASLTTFTVVLDPNTI